MKTKLTNLYLVASCVLLSSAAMARTVNYGKNEDLNPGFSVNKPAMCAKSENSKKYFSGCFHNVTVSDITSNSATLSNTEYAQVNFFQYKVAGATQWTTLSMSGQSVNISGLTPLTQYYFRDSIICSEFAQVNTPVQTFVTSSISYCSAQGNNTAYEWINSIKIGSTTNISGQNNGYGDFTGIFLNASKTVPVNYTLTPGYSGATYFEKWCVWIDFNHDGDFTDPAEKVISTNGSMNSISGTFIIPSNALNGVTRMRIMMSYYSITGPCSNPVYGEVEDYTITIAYEAQKIALSETPKPNSGLACKVYPNPSHGQVNLEIEGLKETAEIAVKDILGQIVYTRTIDAADSKVTENMDLSGLSKGIYMVSVKSQGEVISRQVVIE